jgi:hypothetical protein
MTAPDHAPASPAQAEASRRQSGEPPDGQEAEVLPHEPDSAYKACKHCYRRVPELYPFSWFSEQCDARAKS